MHAAAFLVAIPAGVLLILAADRPSARVAASIYAATLLLVFGTSTAYHRFARSERSRRLMQRLDHSMIYLLIGGTYVPICLLVLPPSWGIPMLAVLGAIAAIGISIKLFAFDRAGPWASALYPIMGWLALVATPVLIDRLTWPQLALIAGGGIAYTVGFPVLVVRRPNPWPRTFGYHEIWHAFTVLAAAMHFAAVSRVVA